jgi:hypothetical protein
MGDPGAAHRLGYPSDIEHGAGARGLPGKSVQRRRNCRIEQRHLRKVENQSLRAFRKLIQCRSDAGGRVEKEGPRKCGRLRMPGSVAKPASLAPSNHFSIRLPPTPAGLS